MKGRAWAMVIVALLAGVLGVRPGVASTGLLPSGAGFAGPTGTGGSLGLSHGWCVVNAIAPGEFALVHIPPRDGGAGVSPGLTGTPDGAVRVVIALRAAPEALGAWEERAALIFAPEARPDGGWSRQVLLTGVRPGPVPDTWVAQSGEGRFAALPPVEGREALAGFVGSDAGWCVLTRDGRLRVLIGVDWAEVPVPTEARAGQGLELLALPGGVGVLGAGPSGGWGLWRGAIDRDDPGASAWTFEARPPPPAGADPRHFWVRGVLTRVERDAEGAVRISVPDAGGERLLTRLPASAPDAAVVPGDQTGRLVIVWSTPAERAQPAPEPPSHPTPPMTIPAPAARPVPMVQEVSVFTGRVLYDGKARAGGPVSPDEWRVLSLVLLGFTAVVLALVVRPTEPDAGAALPDGWALADPGQRAMAGLIDLVPGVLLAAWLFDATLMEVLAPPLALFKRGPVEYLPIVLALGVSAVVSTLGEWQWGRSLGKALAGCAVVRVGPGAERPELWRALARNAVRWYLFPVAWLGMLTGDGRHRGDHWGGTVVVTPVQGPSRGDDAGPGHSGGPG